MVIEITITNGYGTAEVPTTNTDTADVNEQKVTVTPDYLPNILDDFDSYAYHFRLFMMDEESIKKRNITPQSKDRRIIIAETATTTIEIEDVSITSWPAPSKKAGFGTSTDFQFTLRQPLGANLVDKIFAAANKLGIKNFSKVPVFLELSFRAQEPPRDLGTQYTGTLDVRQPLLGEDKLKDIVWVWPLVLTDMAMDVSSGGSTYVIRAGLYSELAYTNQAADIEKKTTVAARTVYDYFLGLEKALARKEQDKVEKSKTQKYPDTYTFYIDKDMSQSKIVPNFAEDVANRTAEFTVENPEKMEYSFDPGISIDKIVETILSTTEYLQKKAKGTENKDAIESPNEKEKAAIQTLYRIIADTQIGEFDDIRNDYARHYRYLIIPYEMTTLQTQSNKAANLKDQQRYDLIRNKGRIRKAYNYIYTGLNDQVFDFDLTFNFNWHAAVPFQAGATTSSTIAEPNAAYEDKSEYRKNAKQDTSPTDEFGAGTGGPSLGEFTDDLSDFFVSADTIGGLAQGIATGDFDQLTGTTSQFLASEVSKGIRVAGKKFAPNLVQNQYRERSPTVEDETVDKPVKLNSAVSFIESSPGIDNRASGGYSDSQGKTLLTTMFEQSTSPVGADLYDISLRVKGDPYWMEPAPLSRNSEFKTLFDVALEKYNLEINPEDPTGQVQTTTPSSNTEVTSINSTSNQEYLLFRSFTPKEADEETGLVPGFDGNNVLNGIYAVRMVEHNFAAGEYTQTIDAVRDLEISLDGLDLGLGVADTRSLLEQFNIENIIDNPATVQDPLQQRESGEDYTATPGGVPNTYGLPDGVEGNQSGVA